MPFSERIKLLAKEKSAHRCCVCHKPFVEVHHIEPQKEGGPDSLENAAPLCSSCHDLFGGNPEKRKTLRQLRDHWWSLMDERRAKITTCQDMADHAEIQNDPNAEGKLRDDPIAIYHVVLENENFDDSARDIFKLIHKAQQLAPNRKRALYIDIEGHRNSMGGFDNDMFELQTHFLLRFMMKWLAELHAPLSNVRNSKIQSNDLPDSFDIIDAVDNDAINSAFDKGVKEIWIADKGKIIRLE